MGGKSSKAKQQSAPVRKPASAPKKKNQVSDQDRAMLELKSARDRLKRYQRKLDSETKVLHEKARELLKSGKKDRAKTMLKLKKLKIQQADKADSQLLTVLEMVETLDFESQQQKVFEGLKAGNAALDAIHKQMTVEDVEDLMMDTQEAQERNDEISRALGGQLSSEDEEAILAELAEIEGMEIDTSEVTAPEAQAEEETLEEKPLPTEPASVTDASIEQSAEVTAVDAAEIEAKLPEAPTSEPIADTEATVEDVVANMPTAPTTDPMNNAGANSKGKKKKSKKKKQENPTLA